jgi:putative ABC transport system permease protein
MVGALLMLAGTLTATSLALGDARPDLATLSAVGAEPRVRRRVAGWYAFGIAGLGAWLGAVVGFVPGLALAHSLTVDQYLVPGVPQGPFYAVPWLLVAAIVVGLPVVMGCVVALGVRSKLPMVARVE